MEGGFVIIHTFKANINQKMKSTVNPKRGRKAVEWLGPQVLSRPVKRTLREAHWKRSQRLIFFLLPYEFVSIWQVSVFWGEKRFRPILIEIKIREFFLQRQHIR